MTLSILAVERQHLIRVSLTLNRNAPTRLASACHLQAKHIVPNSAKMQARREQKLHAIPITLPSQNKVLIWERLTRAAGAPVGCRFLALVTLVRNHSGIRD
jgi:hypothetical protein